MASAIVIADTSVIINFLRIDRVALIGAHPSPFIVRDHEGDEIADAYPEQQARFRAALQAGHITQQRIDDPAEVAILLRLSARGRLDVGERPAIAVAVNRGCALAIDASRAIRRAIEETGITGNPLTIVRTQDAIVRLIKAGELELEAADVIKDNWHLNHRFGMPIASFAELLLSIFLTGEEPQPANTPLRAARGLARGAAGLCRRSDG